MPLLFFFKGGSGSGWAERRCGCIISLSLQGMIHYSIGRNVPWVFLFSVRHYLDVFTYSFLLFLPSLCKDKYVAVNAGLKSSQTL